MNDKPTVENQEDSKQTGWTLIYLAMIVSIASFICGTICILLWLHMLSEKNYFLEDGAAINRIVFSAMQAMIKSAYFHIIPAMSALLLINSVLMWTAFRKLKK